MFPFSQMNGLSVPRSTQILGSCCKFVLHCWLHINPKLARKIMSTANVSTSLQYSEPEAYYTIFLQMEMSDRIAKDHLCTGYFSILNVKRTNFLNNCHLLKISATGPLPGDAMVFTQSRRFKVEWWATPNVTYQPKIVLEKCGTHSNYWLTINQRTPTEEGSSPKSIHVLQRRGLTCTACPSSTPSEAFAICPRGTNNSNFPQLRRHFTGWNCNVAY